ncbi:MAG: hypothetical protein ACJ0BO_01425 [Candidatus Puniceispirillaceae bacterium]
MDREDVILTGSPPGGLYFDMVSTKGLVLALAFYWNRCKTWNYFGAPLASSHGLAGPSPVTSNGKSQYYTGLF